MAVFGGIVQQRGHQFLCSHLLTVACHTASLEKQPICFSLQKADASVFSRPHTVRVNLSPPELQGWLRAWVPHWVLTSSLGLRGHGQI
jgi:hypothetical protein